MVETDLDVLEHRLNTPGAPRLSNDEQKALIERLRRAEATLEKVRHVAHHNAAVDGRYLVNLLDGSLKAGNG